jgi:hypothetical protein
LYSQLHECLVCGEQLPCENKAVDDHCRSEHECTLEEYLDAAEMTELPGTTAKTSSPVKTEGGGGNVNNSSGNNGKGGKKDSVGACVVDFYQDDDLNAHDPNLQLQIVHEAGEEEEEEKGAEGGKAKPMLMDSGEFSRRFRVTV